MQFWTKNKLFWLIVYAGIVTPSVILFHGMTEGLMIGVPSGMVGLGLFTHWRYYIRNRVNVRMR